MEMKIIYNRAWSFHRTTGLAVDDLISQATLIYLEAERKYKDKIHTIKFTTFVYTYITNTLNDYCQKQMKSKFLQLENDDQFVSNRTFDNVLSIDLNLSQFPGRAKEVIMTVFEHAESFDFIHPHKNRGILLRILQKEKNWSVLEIRKWFRVIRDIIDHTAENELFF